ncbi:MAG: hypothetical protein JW755_03300 [Candidatus Aminicenantes bacterium]|nr:hypothetical protein [Candidatus Aminicenantes bacterium]
MNIKNSHKSMIKIIYFYQLFAFLSISLVASDSPPFQKGMAFPTWRAEQYGLPQSDESLKLLKENTLTEWVQLVPTWYQQDKKSIEIMPDYSQNTARPETVRHAIQFAHSLGMKVMLKPHVDAFKGDWRGTFQPDDPEKWFISYKEMITEYALMAQEENVEILSVGCEFLELTKPEFTDAWKEIITAVRGLYSGPLVYSANWSIEYLHIEFWNKLDFVGIDAYFELTDKKDPTLEELLSAWEPYLSEIQSFYEKWNLPILLTEIGYRSLDGGNMQPWNWEIQGSVDPAEQALCYQSVIRTFEGKPWFAGIYWWNWEPDPTLGGPSDTGYTPQKKPAEIILKRWYGGESLQKKGSIKR